MEININFNPYYIFSGEVNEPVSFISSMCEKLSENSICESMDIDVKNISDLRKNELIEFISQKDYNLWLTFESEESYPGIDGQQVNGFRVNAMSGTEGEHFFRSAIIFEIMGLDALCYAMKMEFYARIANDMYQDIIGAELERAVISHVNKVKASKPRHQFYDEVMAVIQATWEKYPSASQTGLHEALCSHYYGKVSRNSLLKWISDSGLRPEKPKKHSAFQLVFPQ